MNRLKKWLTHPVSAAVSAFSGVLAVLHLTMLFQLAQWWLASAGLVFHVSAIGAWTLGGHLGFMPAWTLSALEGVAIVSGITVFAMGLWRVSKSLQKRTDIL